ncbi:phosphatidate cytidylyltransferase [Chelativorans sp. Marseille-P2723]|uniref:phosphatidate cytidylyltransferase n=1 Tax=Chelativorans sp. Marseille-P2723 TaxID=2709133 RepID=UPI00156E297B|nr:phosphatidate cytidylyltransferase [Chelativorans sp. Marseille-P2723]
MSGSGQRNLRLRIISAVILGAGALALTVAGGPAFRIFTAALSLLIFYEWTAMGGAGSRRVAMIAWAGLVVALVAMLMGFPALLPFALLTAAVLIVLLFSWLAGSGIWTAGGLVYAGAPGLALANLRGADEAGLIIILFLYAVVWTTDTLAYFTGRALGGPKLAPSISPGKTWSGAIGGTIGGAAAGAVVLWLLGSAFSLVLALFLAVLLSVVSQAGDLFESAMKRRRGVKDSGSLIPGHGGVMDRVDGLVAAAVLLYLMVALFSPGHTPTGFVSA